MDDRTLLARALDAQGPLPRAPEGFADAVLAALPARPARPARLVRAVRLALPLAAAAGVVAAFGPPWAHEGGRTVGPAAVTVSLGRRAVAVVEPHAALRFRVGGWFQRDRVELTRGAAFFRVDHGRGFDVVTPHGTVTVTGTCFRVETRPPAPAEETPMRSRWFAAGALSALVTVQVYEGGVRLARAGAPHALAVRAGERAHIDPGGRLRPGAPGEGDGAARAAVNAEPAAAQGDANTPGPASPVGAQPEIERLRGLLARHGISPDTGARVDGGASPRGLDDPGDTNLTADEWRVLAQRGETRFRLPASNRREGLDESHARALNVPDDVRAEVNEAFRAAQRELQQTLGALYHEASGAAPGAMSVEALMNEIRDKTPDAVVNDTIWRLAQERGGLLAPPGPDAETSPYERSMRALVGFEQALERRLAPVVGERLAHDMLFGEHAVPGHSFGLTARRSAP
ncbi:MAG: FecR domain-containing protein [Polyangiales bacterium]